MRRACVSRRRSRYEGKAAGVIPAAVSLSRPAGARSFQVRGEVAMCGCATDVAVRIAQPSSVAHAKCLRHSACGMRYSSDHQITRNPSWTNRWKFDCPVELRLMRPKSADDVLWL